MTRELGSLYECSEELDDLQDNVSVIIAALRGLEVDYPAAKQGIETLLVDMEGRLERVINAIQAIHKQPPSKEAA